jgi:hypothetical protein
VGRGRRVHARHPCAHQEHARTLTHSTDRNDAPGLTCLARTGFFKPVHMKASARPPLVIIARKKTGRPASDRGESDPRFDGRVREHNPSIPVARCAQMAAVGRQPGACLNSVVPTAWRLDTVRQDYLAILTRRVRDAEQAKRPMLGVKLHETHDDD